MQLVFYDLDGTLVDTKEDIILGVQYMQSEMKTEVLEAPEIESFVGRGLHYLVGNCLKTEDRKTIEKGADLFRDHYAEHMLDHSRLYPGGREVLQHFRDRKQAVITNKPDPFSTEMLKTLGIADYFCAIIAGNSSYPRKPNPASLTAIMQEQGVAASEALFVGDSAVDIETGRNAGVRTVVMTHGFSSEDDLRACDPDLMVNNFEELLEKIREQSW